MKTLVTQNVGILDRILRVCVGIALVTTAALAVDGTVGVILFLLSIPLLFSGITGFCPTYTLFGISTASPVSKGIPHMQQVCCSADGGFPVCRSMMKHTMEHPDDRSAEPEGRKP